MNNKNNIISLILLSLAVMLSQLLVVSVANAASELPRFLDASTASAIYPDADKIELPTGEPVVATAFKQGTQIGFVFLTSDFSNSTGYSGKPIHQLVAMDMQGVIQKVSLVEHHEPIVLIGIPEKRITATLVAYEGINVGELVRGTHDHEFDVITGATVTVIVMDDNILQSAVKVARLFGLAGLEAEQNPVARQARLIRILIIRKAGKSWCKRVL